MASALHTEFTAVATPELFALCGVTALHTVRNGGTQTSLTILLREEPSSTSDTQAETNDIRRATIMVRTSDVQPGVEDVFSVTGQRAAADQWVVTTAPEIICAVAICACEAIATRNVNPQRAKL